MRGLRLVVRLGWLIDECRGSVIGGDAAAVESVFACMHASAVGGSVGFDRFGLGVDCVLCEAVGAKEWREGAL